MEWKSADAEFAAEWQAALDQATDGLEAEARRRGVDGVERYVVSGGAIVNDPSGVPLKIREYSDQLLLAQLKAHRGELYREKADVRHSGAVGILGILDEVQKMRDENKT